MENGQSYLDFFGLREEPFAPTADPTYFYATREHRECLFRLWSSIDARHGIAVILGNYGTGKTALLRKLLTGMTAAKERYTTAIVGSPIPSWTSFALLETIVEQFRLQPPKRSFGCYMEALNRYLLQNRDRICTLIIDDAQNLNKRGQLELLRLAQNLETHQHKLLNLVLFAQLEWIEVLRAAPNFEQRINLTYTLRPVPLDETRQLIEFRIRQGGGMSERRPMFDDGAVRVIHAFAEGNPRVIVTLCRNALLVASQIRSRQIGSEIVLHTIEKTTVPDAEKRARAVSAARMSPSPNPPMMTAHKEERVVKDFAPNERTSREQRAAELLLRAAARGRKSSE
jgi:type II secretory pathway predicted ATPase ExeA